MNKIMITAVAAAALAITPAFASKPATHPNHPTTPAKCKINTVGYNAKGTLVSQSLTQTKGAETPTDKSDDRWSGNLTVNVTTVNHKAPKGNVNYTLTDAKVALSDANSDG